jgi:hypothetical protein
MDDKTIDTTELLARLLAVMPACWLEKLAENIEKLYADTGHGEVGVIVYRGRIVQINRIVKER